MYRQLVTGNQIQIKYFVVKRATLPSTVNQLLLFYFVNFHPQLSTWLSSEAGEGQVEESEAEESEIQESEMGEG